MRRQQHEDLAVTLQIHDLCRSKTSKRETTKTDRQPGARTHFLNIVITWSEKAAATSPCGHSSDISIFADPSWSYATKRVQWSSKTRIIRVESRLVRDPDFGSEIQSLVLAILPAVPEPRLVSKLWTHVENERRRIGKVVAGSCPTYDDDIGSKLRGFCSPLKITPLLPEYWEAFWKAWSTMYTTKCTWKRNRIESLDTRSSTSDVAKSREGQKIRHHNSISQNNPLLHKNIAAYNTKISAKNEQNRTKVQLRYTIEPHPSTPVTWDPEPRHPNTSWTTNFLTTQSLLETSRHREKGGELRYSENQPRPRSSTKKPHKKESDVNSREQQ